MVFDMIIRWIFALGIWVWLSTLVFYELRSSFGRVVLVMTEGLGFLLGLTTMLIYGRM